jgi:hypothetical protein
MRTALKMVKMRGEFKFYLKAEHHVFKVVPFCNKDGSIREQIPGILCDCACPPVHAGA